MCSWYVLTSLFIEKYHNGDVITTTTASQITSLTVVYSIVYSDANQRKHQSSASLAFVRGIHRWPVNSPHKGPVTRKMFPFDDVIIRTRASVTIMMSWQRLWCHINCKRGYFITARSHEHHSVSDNRHLDCSVNSWVTSKKIPKGHGFGKDFDVMLLYRHYIIHRPWWRHQMEKISALLAICAGNSPVTGEFPAQRPVTRSFDVSSDLRLTNQLSKQSWGWWFETPSCLLWRHTNVYLGAVRSSVTHVFLCYMHVRFLTILTSYVPSGGHTSNECNMVESVNELSSPIYKPTQSFFQLAMQIYLAPCICEPCFMSVYNYEEIFI